MTSALPRSRTTWRARVTALVVASGVIVAPTALPGLSGPAAAAPRATPEDVGRRVTALHRDAERATEEYDALRERIASLGVRRQGAEARVAAQTSKVAAARRALVRIAVDTYKGGDLSALELVLSDRPDVVLAGGQSLAFLTERRAQVLAELAAEQRRLRDVVTDLAEQERRLAAARAQMSGAKDRVEASLDSARAQLGSLRAGEREQLARAGRSQERAGLRAVVGKDLPDHPSCARAGVRPGNGRTGKVLSYLCAHIGDPYRWAGAGPAAFDCSGLSQQAWKRAGVSLPHNAAMQSRYGRRVAAGDLRAGDLVFFHRPITHMGIYVGKGLMIAAPQTGDVVKVQPVRFGELTAAARL